MHYIFIQTMTTQRIGIDSVKAAALWVSEPFTVICYVILSGRNSDFKDTAP